MEGEQQRTDADTQRPLPTAPTMKQRWFPIGAWLPRYRWGKSASVDLVAAVSVAALLIPESMGYASIAGVPVQVGLYAAPLALIAYAMFGGSKLLVFGAAGSVAAVSASVVGGLSGGDQDTAVALTVALAFATGAVFLVLGLARMGWMANFMSKAIMAGFIAGMSIQIIVGQFGKLFGVTLTGDNTFEKLWSTISQIGDWNWAAVTIGIGSLVLIFAIQRFVPKVPAAFAAVIVASVIVAVFAPDLDLVAQIPQGLPSLTVPTGIDASTWGTLLAGGAVVALVGFSEGLGSIEERREDHPRPTRCQSGVSCLWREQCGSRPAWGHGRNRQHGKDLHGDVCRCEDPDVQHLPRRDRSCRSGPICSGIPVAARGNPRRDRHQRIVRFGEPKEALETVASRQSRFRARLHDVPPGSCARPASGDDRRHRPVDPLHGLPSQLPRTRDTGQSARHRRLRRQTLVVRSSSRRSSPRGAHGARSHRLPILLTADLLQRHSVHQHGRGDID